MIPARAPLYRAHKIVFCSSKSDITMRDIMQAYIVIELSTDTFRVVKNMFSASNHLPQPISELAEFVSKAYADIKHREISRTAVVDL